VVAAVLFVPALAVVRGAAAGAVVSSPLDGGQGANARGGQRRRRDQRKADGDRQQEQELRQILHGGHEGNDQFFTIGPIPQSLPAGSPSNQPPVAWVRATSDSTSSYCARVRLRRACVRAACDSNRSVVVAAPALSAASVTR
jgi:hypothetical protein